MPFFCRFSGLHLSFCVPYLFSMAPQLPSRGCVTFSVPCLSLFDFLASFSSEEQARASPIIGATLPNWLTDDSLVDALAA